MNNTLVEINNTTLGIKEYQGQRVITFKDIDRVHERPDGTARKAFNRNKEKFIENKDYFILTRDNPMSVLWTMNVIPPKGLTLITESGYYMIAKVFDDEIAWDVQRQLTDGYFKFKKISIEDKLTVAIDNMTNTLSSMNERLSKLEEQPNKKKLPEKKYSRWKTNTFKKLNALLSYVNENSDESLKLSEIIHLVIEETENTHNIDINDYTEAYKSEFELEITPYTIDVINYYKDIRDSFTLTLDSIMDKLHISEEFQKNRTKNIFDELAAKIETIKDKTKEVT